MPIASERRTTPVELLWDLVFVFAITQVAALLSHDLSWAGFGRAMLVLALVWWAWSAFVWAANAVEPDSATLRAVLLVATLLIFIAGIAVPHAFSDEAPLFALAYAGVRLMHLALYADASRRGRASWAAIAGFAVTVLAGMALLVAGSLLDGSARVALWALAAAIDYAGPAWLTRERLAGLQQVAVAHFAERYGLFIIICLGESIVAIGVGAGDRPVDAGLVAAAALGLVVTLELWWTYFDRFAATAEERLRAHDNPVLAAADAYSYLHLVLVAGIIVFAVGVEIAVHDVGAPLETAARLALCGGVAAYLAGHVAFRMRLVGAASAPKLVAAAAALAIFAAGGALPAWAVAGALALVLGVLCAYESAVERDVAGLSAH
ncbi:MAG TPA: low temperature requirement protein A [Solirubrobacteraceae bacterium]|nr:low temperature requirement protein A [Solirubrobacteraceae bacterium]